MVRFPDFLRACAIAATLRLRLLADDDRGASAVEYSLIAFFVAAVIFGVVTLLGKQVSSEFNSLVGTF